MPKVVAVHASTHVCLASLSVLLLTGFCFSQPTVSVSPKNGPPTSKLLVSGKGFTPYAAIDIYFDTKDEALAIADGSGSFSKIAIQVLASAVPGKHWVSAVQRSRRAGAQAPFLVNTNWSQFHFTPDHKGLNPYENVLNTGNVGSIGLLWNYTTDATVPHSPAVANGMVYAGSEDGNVYALNASTGALRWSYPAGGGSPAVADGVVYVGTFYALNGSSGAVQWSDSLSGAPPTVANGVIYLGSANEDYAVNASDGSEVWRAHYGYAAASSMAYANGVVYFGTTNGGLYALNAGDGGDRLCAQPGSGYSSPAVANGVVYAGSSSGVIAVNAITCTTLWNFTSGYAVTSSSPAIANGVVYVGSDGGNIYALNASTGTLLWSYATGGMVESSPAVANGVVYVGSDDGNIYALNAGTGALLWSYSTGGMVQSSPAVANGVIYVGSNDGNLYAFGLTGGTRTNGVAVNEQTASNRPDLRILRPDLNGYTYTSGPPIGFVQVAAATPRSSESSVSVTYPSAQTAGDLNIVVVGWNDTTSSVQSVKDSHGLTYTSAASLIRGTKLSQTIYYLKDIPSGSNTVTVTFTQPATLADIRILEYSGLDLNNPLDASASASGNSKAASSGSAPTNASSELIFGADTVFTGNKGPGAGFTARIITAPDSNLAEDETVSSPGTYSATAPLTASGPWVMQMATFMSPPTPATGPLRVSSSNSRYFADGSGNNIYLTGSHTWPNNNDGWGVTTGCPIPPPFDWADYLTFVQSNRYNWVRLWTWELPTSNSEPYPGQSECHLPVPFLRTGPGNATDGKPKFDLTQFDQGFFDRLRERVIDNQQRGIYVSVMLFDGFGLDFDRLATDGYWFTLANNINGIDDGYTGGSSGYKSQNLSNPAITEFQDAYVEKVIDSVNDLPNVLYEVVNEAGSYSTSWQEHLIDLVHTYEATKPYQHPVGFSCQYPGGNDSTYFNSAAEYVEPCNSGYGWPVTETSTGEKVVIDNTDHSWPWMAIQQATQSDPAAMRKWVWENFTRGANTGFMDPYLTVWPVRNNPSGNKVDPYWNVIRTGLSQTATYSRQIDLAHMIPCGGGSCTPQNSLCSTTFCLASSGQQYLVYAPTGGEFTVTLTSTPTTYSHEWFNPQTSTVAATGEITGSGTQSFTPPFSGDAVLLLRVQ